MLIPLANKIIVRRLDAESRTPGGIMLPDSAKEKPCKGIVLSVGPGRTTDNGIHIAMEVKPQQTILFGKYAGNEVEHEDEKLVILTEPEVMAVIK